MSYLSSGYVLCGLIPVYNGKREDYPLLNAEVHYDLSDVQMLANLTQTYTSNASTEAEIRYVFPLPSDSAVCSFKAIIDGKRTIKGVVKEKEKAKAEYEDAVSQGKTAALLQQDNVEIFQVSLGNIRPKQTIEVHISFVCLVAHDGTLDSLRLNFPSTIAPRYGTSPSGTLGSPGWGTSSPSRSALDFSVAVEMTSQIRSITSPSHPIAMKLGESTLEPSSEFDPTKARVSLSSPALLEKDIVIVLSCQGLDKPRCTVESFSPEEGAQEYTDAYALMLVPRFDLPSLTSQEYIFLVDRSGSMGGGKMGAVRSALQILLMSLPSRGTSFNIISFGSSHTSLWPSSATYSAESVKAASAHVDSMSSNYGGTEIRAAMEAAFASRAANPVVAGETRATSVFVLTDGQASDLEGVRNAVREKVVKAKADKELLRVFCMGIGNAVSKAMCEMIARAGQGTAAFVGEQEKPDQKLMGLLRAARGGVVDDISIDWGVGENTDIAEPDSSDFEMISSQVQSPKEAPPLLLFDESHTTTSENTEVGPQIGTIKLPPPPRVQQAPATESLPSLYPGFRTSLFAIVRRGTGGNTAPSKGVRIKGTVLGRPVVLEVPVSQVPKTKLQNGHEQGSIKMLHVLGARALIQSIEDKAEIFNSEVDKAEVLRLAERYGLASSQTSFVAIDEEGDPINAVRRVVHAVAAEDGSSWTASTLVGKFKSRRGRGRPTYDIDSQLQSLQGDSSASLFGGRPTGAATPVYGGRGLFGASSVRTVAPPPPPPSAPAYDRRALPGAAPTSGSSSLFGLAPSSFSGAPSPNNAPGPPSKKLAMVFPRQQPQPRQQQQQQQQQLGSTNPGVPQPKAFGSSLYNSLFLSAAPALAPAEVAVSSDLMEVYEEELQKTAQLPLDSDDGYERTRERPVSHTSLSAKSVSPGTRAFRRPSVSSPSVVNPLPSSIESFARAQSFDGSFVGSPALFQLLVSQPHAPPIPAALGAAQAFKEAAWCTLLCVAYLEAKFVGEKDVWVVIVEKAMAWVEDALKDTAGPDSTGAFLKALKEDAKKCIA